VSAPNLVYGLVLPDVYHVVYLVDRLFHPYAVVTHLGSPISIMA
jgi:hypothetical protein